MQTTVQLLRRYEFLERCALRALAGWFLLVPAFEDKIHLGYQLWAHAERVNTIRARLQEMRGGHSEANTEPALQQFGRALLDAPNAHAFLAGYRWLLDQLESAYRTHRAMCDGAANAAEIRLLDQLADDVTRALVGDHAIAVEPGPINEWVHALHGLLRAAGGASGMDTRRAAPTAPTVRFDRPATLHFDDRIERGTFAGYVARLELDFPSRRVAELEIFFNEFYAAALLAGVLFDAWDSGLPWAFFHDLSHHFWDEVRHAEFGMMRLRELDLEPRRVDLRLLEHAQAMPVLHRICYLTLGLEVFFMPRKRPRVARYRDAGDPRTQLLADVDWSDEGNHVKYGKRWVDYLLTDDARSVQEVQDEIAEHMRAVLGDLPAGQLAPY